VDYDFPLSRTIFEHGAIAGLIALSGSRRRVALAPEHPLASFGVAFLL
jgi:hypothetical protein